jgi:DNA repair protein SbcD/Mre11
LKILHTADLHLNSAHPERWKALEEIVAIAVEKKVSLLIIAGDLFDQHSEAEQLRGDLRKLLSGSDLRTVILPGNHDYKAYRSGLYFGENVYLINNWTEPLILDQVSIWGLPFEKMTGEKLISRLREMGSLMDRNQCNLLLFHGELLDAYFSRRDMGDEGEERYMPVHLADFEALPVKYVLGGHFHSSFRVWDLHEGGYFIYPGSPVSITRRETGRRFANYLVVGERPEEVELNTYHFEELRIILDPFDLTDPLLMLDQKVKQVHPLAQILLTVEGLFDGSKLKITESELAYEIRRIAGERLAGEPLETFADVQHVIEDELFIDFMNKLMHTEDCKENVKEIRELVIKAFRTVKSCS